MWKTLIFLFLTRVLLFHPDVKLLWTVCGNGSGRFLFHLPCGKEKLNVENSVQKVENFPPREAVPCPAGDRGWGFPLFLPGLWRKGDLGLDVFDDVVHRFP